MSPNLKLLLLLNLISLSLSAQFENTLQLKPGNLSPPASLESASWIQGEWIGEGLGGQCEEVWSAPRAGSMLGTFRLIHEDKLMFSEFMEILETDGSLLLRLKHFSNDFVGWEDKDKFVEFKLVKLEDDVVYFDGLTYRKSGANSMDVYVVIDSDGTQQEAKFSYARNK